jgi:tetratricopeptide (TPR) repeat protein
MQPEPQDPAYRTSKFTPWVVCAALVGLVWIAFGQSLHYGFLNWDDIIYIRDYPEVSAGLSAKGFVWAWTHPHYSNWHPLTTLSFMLDSTVFKKNAAGFHAHNLLLHAAATLFLFFAIRRMTGDIWKSAAAAAVFSLHPLRVESVAWITERKDVLSGLFLMVTLWAYAKYAQQPSVRRMLWVCLWHACGLLSKSMLVTLPALLLTLDFWPLARLGSFSGGVGSNPDDGAGRADCSGVSWRFLLIEKLPLLALSAASCVATVLSMDEHRPMTPPPFLARMEYVPIWLITYLRLFLFPTNLAAHYPYSQTGPAFTTTVQALVLVALISYACVLLRRISPMLLMGWCWFAVALLPVIGILPPGIQIIADRYTYVPQIGFSMCAIWALAEGLKALRFRWVCPAIAVCWIVMLALVARMQTSHWRSDEALWRHAVDVTTTNDFGNGQLGDSFAVQGKLAEAEPFYREALRINPNLPGVLNNLGFVLRSLGKPMDAEPYLRKALEVSPWFVNPRFDLADILIAKNSHAEAVEQFREILKSEPNNFIANYKLGMLMSEGAQELRDLPSAVQLLRRAGELNPQTAEVQFTLGNALFRAERIDESIGAFQRALELDPKHARAANNLGTVLGRTNRLVEAVEYFRAAIQIDPSYADAMDGLTAVLFESKQYKATAEVLRDAVQKRPSDLRPIYKLAWLLATAMDDSVRDPSEARRLASYAIEHGASKEPLLYDVIAAAHAADGEFAKAIELSEKALEVFSGVAGAAADLKTAIESHAKVFREGKPWRE